MEKKFPRYWPFVRGIHRSPVNSPHKGQWRGALMFSLICACINGWVNNWDAGECGITVMLVSFMSGLRFIRLTALMYLILWYVLPLYNNESMDFAIEVTHRIGSSVEHLFWSYETEFDQFGASYSTSLSGVLQLATSLTRVVIGKPGLVLNKWRKLTSSEFSLLINSLVVVWGFPNPPKWVCCWWQFKANTRELAHVLARGFAINPDNYAQYFGHIFVCFLCLFVVCLYPSKSQKIIKNDSHVALRKCDNKS